MHPDSDPTAAPEAAAELARSRIKRLYLSDVDMNDAGLMSMVDVWNNDAHEPPPLAHLSLRDNTALSTSALVALARSKTPFLEFLYLEGCRVSTDGAEALAVRLEMPGCRLNELRMPSSEIGDAGAKSIARALKTNTSLKKLDIGLCDITDDGILAIAEAIEVNRTLEWIDISSNRIQKETAMKLAVAIVLSSATVEVESHGHQAVLNEAMARRDIVHRLVAFQSGDRNKRAEIVYKFLSRSGDNAVMARVMQFMGSGVRGASQLM